MTGREGEMEREREEERGRGRERERERETVYFANLYIIVMTFFSTAGGYFVAVRGRLSPDKLLLNN